jgi:DNA polymerase (family 10)
LDNQAIARILREIADLLEIKDDNPFKIRAYRNGADIASNHPHDLARLDETGLREIPGIGKDLAARIVEIAQTGDTAYHRELVAEFPPTILDLLHLQGVGPKTVATLYRELGIRTLDDLERACADGRIRSLRGMGSKKEALLLTRRLRGDRGPPRHRQRTARRRWGERSSHFCTLARPKPSSRRSAACAAAATRAGIWICWRRGRRRR